MRGVLLVVLGIGIVWIAVTRLLVQRVRDACSRIEDHIREAIAK